MTETIIWSAPPSGFRLKQDEVHLWRADLDTQASNLAAYLELFNDEERSRRGNFLFETDRIRFTAARGILRQLVGGYLDCSPKRVEFASGSKGKPAIPGNSELRFNQSDSGGMALYVFSLGRELGLDVETTSRNQVSNRDVVRQYFSEKEQAEFFALEAAQQEEAFYLGWTRKEAYIKARGEGLHADLKSFDVSLTPGRPFLLTSADAHRWSLYSFCPKAGYAAALVVEGDGFNLVHWEWRGNTESPA